MQAATPAADGLRSSIECGSTSDVRGRDGDCSPPTGSPEAVAHIRFPQNVAAALPHHALRQLIHSTASACSFR